MAKKKGKRTKTGQKRRYKINPTPKQLRIMKLYWAQFKDDQDVFFSLARSMEKAMSREIGIRGLEFIRCDGDYVGIGNGRRTMKLIQQEELEA